MDISIDSMRGQNTLCISVRGFLNIEVDNTEFRSSGRIGPAGMQG